MPKIIYHLGDYYNNSDIEEDDDEGNSVRYHFYKKSGQGAYANARVFIDPNENHKLIVLDPIDGAVSYEIKAKIAFFKRRYGKKNVFLIEFNEDYRAGLPYIEGIAFNELAINSYEQLIKIFLSATAEIKECHNRGIIYLDLKEDNFIYDKQSNQSFLIDGGLFADEGKPVCPQIFQKKSIELVHNALENRSFLHLAPECWSTGPIPAHSSMDVYSFGRLMETMCIRYDYETLELEELIDSCITINPEERISLKTLENRLTILLNKSEQPINENKKLNYSFFSPRNSGITSPKEKRETLSKTKLENSTSSLYSFCTIL